MEAISIAIVFGISGWMLKTWLTHQERLKELSVDAKRIGSAEERLARMEHTVESIALEIERIGEGQRHVTSLLSERALTSLPRE
jgi:hypothetical protein